MRRRAKFNFNPKHLLITGIIICIILIIISFRFGEYLSPVRNAVGTVITPMQKGINIVGTEISDKIDTFQNMKKLTEENQRLKDQVSVLSYENKLLLQNKYELDELRS